MVVVVVAVLAVVVVVVRTDAPAVGAREELAGIPAGLHVPQHLHRQRLRLAHEEAARPGVAPACTHSA